MYHNLTYFQDLHIISKVISVILVIWGICFVQNLYFLLLFACLFMLFFRNKISFLLIFAFFLLSFAWYPISVFFIKMICIYSVLSLLFQTVCFSEIRSFLEYFFYRKKDSKIIYISLYICYFFKYYIIFLKEFCVFRKSCGKRWSISFLKNIIVQSFDKTLYKMKNIMTIYRYRFYNILNCRTYVENLKMTSIDLKYLSTVVIIVCMIYAYWR